jgi:hypothetical protein
MFLRDISQKSQAAAIYPHQGNMVIPGIEKRLQKGTITPDTENIADRGIKILMGIKKTLHFRVKFNSDTRLLVKSTKNMHTDPPLLQNTKKLLQYRSMKSGLTDRGNFIRII